MSFPNHHLGHIAPEATKQLCHDGLIMGISLHEPTEITDCDSCTYAKMTCKPVPKESCGKRADAPGGEVHTDMWGPLPIKMLGRRSYYITFTDNKMRYTCMYLLSHKSEALKEYIKYEC